MRTIKLWKKMVERVANMPEFHDRDDFEVNLIKFTKNLRIPGNSTSTDFSYVAHDCFHLSQKGHSIFAMNLWNQILTSDNERAEHASFDYKDIKCPSEAHPFIRTRKN